MATNRFTWREKSPGLWARSMDRTELHFAGIRSAHMAHGKEWGMLSTILKLDMPFSADEFVSRTNMAWQHARNRHPILASTVASDTAERVYRVATPSEIEAWLAETLIVHDDEVDAESLRLGLSPVDRGTLHILPRKRELLLQISHHQIDGHAILRLVEQLLNDLNAADNQVPDFSHEISRLAPAPSVAANYRTPTPESQKLVQEAINGWFMGYPSSGVGASNIYHSPGATHTQRMVLSREESASVLAACKKAGLTPTYVVEGAAIVASRQIDKRARGIAGDMNYCSCGLFSLRPWCSAENRDAALPLVMFIPQVIRPAPFMETALQLKAYYESWTSNPDILVEAVDPALEAFAAAKQALSDPEPNQMLSVSSFGKFEPRLNSTHGSVAIKDFLFVYETPDPGVSSFSWTRDGQLSWTVCYNESYHRGETIAEWVELTKTTFLEGLALAAK